MCLAVFFTSQELFTIRALSNRFLSKAVSTFGLCAELLSSFSLDTPLDPAGDFFNGNFSDELNPSHTLY